GIMVTRKIFSSFVYQRCDLLDEATSRGACVAGAEIVGPKLISDLGRGVMCECVCKETRQGRHSRIVDDWSSATDGGITVQSVRIVSAVSQNQRSVRSEIQEV